jgi:hypothetical protein
MDATSTQSGRGDPTKKAMLRERKEHFNLGGRAAAGSLKPLADAR